MRIQQFFSSRKEFTTTRDIMKAAFTSTCCALRVEKNGGNNEKNICGFYTITCM